MIKDILDRDRENLKQLAQEETEFWMYMLASLKNDVNMPRMSVEIVYDVMLFPEILEDILNSQLKGSLSGEAKYITKEFPIRLCHLKSRLKNSEDNTNRSISADFLMHDNDTLYLVELKTDIKSLNDIQLDNYNNLTDKPDVEAFINTLLEEQKRFLKSKYKGKYALQEQEINNNLLNFGFDNFKNLKVIYIVPMNLKKNKPNTGCDKKLMVSLEDFANEKEYPLCNLSKTFQKIWRYTQDLQTDK